MILGLFIFGGCLSLISGYGKIIFPGSMSYRAAQGQDAVLPCGSDTVSVDEPGSYVRWVRDDGEIIYKYPDHNYTRALVLEHNFTRKCTGLECPDNTWLLIEHVKPSDAGSYQCRVHKRGLPTSDYTMKLIVVGPPGKPEIYSESGALLKDIVGPLREGANLVLNCEVPKGHSDTIVWWERNGVAMKELGLTVGTGGAQITRMNLGRDENDAKYVCNAQNAEVSEPISTTVVVKMILLPLSVEIRLNKDQTFNENEPRVVDCVIVGSMPPPTVTWTLGGVPLKSNIHTEHNDGNYTVSSLTLVPTMKDHGANLTCKAVNYIVPEKPFEKEITLKVKFRPVCIGNKEPPTIGVTDEEPEAAICMVKAYPAPDYFKWIFAFEDIASTKTLAKKADGTSDVYTSAYTWGNSRKYAGHVQLLTCYAANSMGEQTDPCKFVIRRGGPPSQPICEMVAQPPEDIVVNCSETWDGGREAIYHLEVHNWDENTTKTYSAKKGLFKIKEHTASNISGVIYRTSSRGRGKEALLTLSMLPPHITQGMPENEDHRSGYGWAIIVIVVIAGAVAMLIAQCSYVINRQIQWPQDTPRFNGLFHREAELPVLTREELRPNVIVSRGPICPSVAYTRAPSPDGTCRVLMGCRSASLSSVPDILQRQAFYV